MDDLNDQRTQPLLEPLNDRECEVLNGLAQGLSNREIAHQLSLALSTVKWYVNQINQKLGTRNRSEIINRAQRLGLLDDKSERAPPKHNLPHQTTPFVGRTAELDEIYALLTNPDVRLLTILAPGGMGKTRLALEAAAQQLYNFRHGVYFVPLQSLSGPEHIIQHIATSTGGYQFTQDGRGPKQQVLDYLANKRILLVLDNFEHLLDGAVLISEILQAAPGVKVLVTSREKLNLSGETVYSLRGMQFPTQQMSDVLEYDAVKLLVQAARRVKPDWALTEADFEDVVCVCRLTQGMPLAIVLAASWLDVFSLDRICDEIEQSADILQTDMRDVPERLRSIRAVFEYSWERLKPVEQRVFMKMSVFRGGCTPRAAEHITGASPRVLQALVSKALLTQNQSGRYDIHELLRQYAQEHLEASSEAETVRDAHMQYYADAMHEREADLKGYRQLAALNEIETDFENVQAAWKWSIKQRRDDAIDRMVEAFTRYISISKRIKEGEELLHEAIQHIAVEPDKIPKLLLAKLQVRLGHVLTRMTRVEEAEALLTKTFPIVREYCEQKEQAYCLFALSTAIGRQGRLGEALTLAEESLSLYSESSDNRVASLHANVGYLCWGLGHKERGYQHTLQAYHLYSDLGDKAGIAWTLNNLGAAAWENGEWDIAYRHWQEALVLRQEIGNRTLIASSLSTIAILECIKGHFEEAERLAKESLTITKDMERSYGITAGLANEIAIALQELSRIPEVHRNYIYANELAQEAFAYATLSGNFDTIAAGNLRLGSTLCYLEAYDDANSYLLIALEHYLARVALGHLLQSVVPFSMMLAYKGNLERAAQLLGLVFQHRIQMPWLEKHPRLTEVRHNLKAELGEDAYNTAWERGKSLDLETVAQELLAEFGNGT